MLDYLVPVACIHNIGVSAIQGSGLEGLCCRQKNHFHYNNKYIWKSLSCLNYVSGSYVGMMRKNIISISKSLGGLGGHSIHVAHAGWCYTLD